MQGTTEARREVHARDDVMRCSCCWPITYLLPCRHVLALNLVLFSTPFMRCQVGQRWLRAFMPPPEAPSSLTTVPEVPLPTSIPSYLPSSSSPGPGLPTRVARHGQLMGYCATICTRAADYKDIFFTVLTQVEALAQWVEAQTSGTGVAAAPAHAPFRPPVQLSSDSVERMHPSVGADQLVFPEARKKRKGRRAEARQEGKGERAQKQARKKTAISASQA